MHFYYFFRTWVRLGEYNTLTEPDCLNSDDCAESVLDIEIHEKIRHPRYDKPYAQNDIGLVRLRRSLPRLFTCKSFLLLV